MKKTICILLPGRLDRPVGGHKIVYQYANHLAEAGYSVIIANSIFEPSKERFFIELMRRGHALVRFCLRAIKRDNSCRKWFTLKKGIKEVCIWSYSHHFIPTANIYIATDATTSPFLLQYPVRKEFKFYFIQGYENWRLNDEQLLATYHYPLNKIVISHWISDLLIQHGESCTIVPNGYDPTEYYMTIPIGQKERNHVSMLYHEDPIKNSAMGFKALDLVKESIPELKVSIFGVYPKPPHLPSFCTYYQAPALDIHRQINNVASIYIGTSDNEGWGLTIMEAMACGQAVACTDNKGYQEIAKNNQNALLSPIGNERQLANHIIRLIRDDALRIRLAENGYRSIQAYSITECAQQFEACLASHS